MHPRRSTAASRAVDQALVVEHIPRDTLCVWSALISLICSVSVAGWFLRPIDAPINSVHIRETKRTAWRGNGLFCNF